MVVLIDFCQKNATNEDGLLRPYLTKYNSEVLVSQSVLISHNYVTKLIL